MSPGTTVIDSVSGVRLPARKSSWKRSGVGPKICDDGIRRVDVDRLFTLPSRRRVLFCQT